MGSPTKYRPEMIDIMLDLKGQGQSDIEVAVALGINAITMVRWADDATKPEWQEAWALGKQRCEAWWERLGRLICLGEIKSSPVSYIFNMKCRFGGKWLEDGTRNKLEVTNKTHNMSDKELNQRIKGLLANNPLLTDNSLAPINIIDLGLDKVQDISEGH
jgi:hypothetical protein